MAGNSPHIHHTDQSASAFHWRPILTALAAIGAVALTVMAAFTLSLQELTLPAPAPLSTLVVSQPTPSSTPSPSPTFTVALQPSPTSTIPTGGPVVEPTATPIPVVPTSTATKTPTRVPSPTPYYCTPRTDWDRYTVQAGDTLATVAARYHIAIPELMHANCLISQTLFPGQVIYVPPVATPGPTPTRQPPSGRTCTPSGEVHHSAMAQYTVCGETISRSGTGPRRPCRAPPPPGGATGSGGTSAPPDPG